jgi:hypothetical protein
MCIISHIYGELHPGGLQAYINSGTHIPHMYGESHPDGLQAHINTHMH